MLKEISLNKQILKTKPFVNLAEQQQSYYKKTVRIKSETKTTLSFLGNKNRKR